MLIKKSPPQDNAPTTFIEQLKYLFINSDKCPLCCKQLTLDLSAFDLFSDKMYEVTSCEDHFSIDIHACFDDRKPELYVLNNFSLSELQTTYNLAFRYLAFCKISKSSFNDNVFSYELDVDISSIVDATYRNNLSTYNDSVNGRFSNIHRCDINFPISEEKLLKKIKTLQIYS